MRVFGKFMGGHRGRNFAPGGYAAFDAEWVHVETYSGGSVEEDERCFLKLGASYLSTSVKKSDGGYMTPDEANALVAQLAAGGVLALDSCGMAFFDVWDVIPDSIAVRNEVDEDFSVIPLEVTGV